MREEMMGSLEKLPHLRTVLWRQLRADERPVSANWAPPFHPLCVSPVSTLDDPKASGPQSSSSRLHLGLSKLSTALQQWGQMDSGGGTQFGNSLRAEQGWAGRGAGSTRTPFLHAVPPPPSGLLSAVPQAFSTRESRRTERMWPVIL